MNLLFTILLLVAALAIVLACAWHWNRSAEFCNVAEGVYPTGVKTYKVDGAITTRYLLVKSGSDAQHVALNAAVADKILGVCVDEPAAAEDEAAIFVLGAGNGTIKMVAGAAIAVDAYLSPDGTGKVVTAVATRYAVGKALTAAGASGDEIEVAPILGDRVL
jgi:hypothetical protein